MKDEPRRYIAVDIGGTKCAVSLAEESGHFLERRELRTPEYDGPARIVDTLVKWAQEMTTYCESTFGTQPMAVGISSGGPLNRESGMILSPPNLPGWNQVPIVSHFYEHLRIPTFLENDANAGALAEWRFGAGRGYSNVIFLTFGTGMGAGLILNGRLYRGTNDLAGEVGHIRLSDDGPRGYGKDGSFEGHCSGGAISRRGQRAAEEAISAGQLCGFCPDKSSISSISAKEVTEAARKGDPLATQIVKESATYLGKGLAILLDVLNPQRIVIGSVYRRNEELFRDIALAELTREALPGAVEVCTVVPSELGERIGDYAALSVAITGLQDMAKHKEES